MDGWMDGWMVMMSKDQCVADIGHRLIEVRKGKAVRWREG